MRLWSGLVVLALLVVTSCTSRTSDRPGPTLKPLKLAAQPTWTTGLPAGQLTDLVVRDDVALVVSTDQLMLIDLATGIPRWDITIDDQLVGGNGAGFVLPHDGKVYLVAHDGGLAVLIEYSLSPCGQPSCDQTGIDVSPEVGVMLLSIEDGSLLVKTPVLSFEPTAARRAHGYYFLRAVSDQVALVTISSPGSHQRQTSPDVVRAVAYDIHTGQQLWEQPRMWPFAITDDIMLGTEGADQPTSPPGWDKLRDSKVVALDRATGTRKWDLNDRFTQSEVVLTTGDLTLVRGYTKGKDEAEAVLVDTTDGHELSRIGTDRVDECAMDDQIVACKVPNGLDVYDANTDKLTRLNVRATSVDAVMADRIFLTDTKHSYTIDTTGNRIDKALPGMIRAIGPGHVVFGPTADDLDTEPVSFYTLAE